MRDPENVLNSLQEHSAQSGYVYDRLYRNLFNREFFLRAYQNIYASQGNMTAGTDGKTIDAMSLERIDRLIATLKDDPTSPNRPDGHISLRRMENSVLWVFRPLTTSWYRKLSVCCWNPSMRTALRTPPMAFGLTEVVTQL